MPELSDDGGVTVNVKYVEFVVLYVTRVCLELGLTVQPDGLEAYSTMRLLSSFPVFFTITVTVLALPVNPSGSAPRIWPDGDRLMLTDFWLDHTETTEV